MLENNKGNAIEKSGYASSEGCYLGAAKVGAPRPEVYGVSDVTYGFVA